jgi:hypothetical protein
MKITGDSSATTLPASMGLLAPEVATVITPSLSFAVVTSHAMILQQRPKIGDKVAAHLFCPFHIRVRVAGRTAEEIMTPMKTYNQPMLTRYVSTTSIDHFDVTYLIPA